jgi:hypothetical protein
VIAARLFAGLEAIEALVRVYPILGLPQNDASCSGQRLNLPQDFDRHAAAKIRREFDQSGDIVKSFNFLLVRRPGSSAAHTLP